MTLQVVDNDWFKGLAAAVITAAVEPQTLERTPELLAEFDKLDGMVKAHAIARGEHEAMVYMALYVMWNKSLWVARFNSWDDYCWDIDRMPFGVGFSSIKHKMSEIRKLLAAGASPETVVKVMGKVPTAMTTFINVFVDGKGDNAVFARKFIDDLPAQTTPDDYLQDLAELGPVEAIAAVNRMAGRPSVWVSEADYNLREQKILFHLVVEDDELGRAETDCVISNVPEWGYKAILFRLLGRGRYFARQNEIEGRTQRPGQ